MPDNLHTRLVASLRARLEVARAATPGPWHVAADGEVETVRGDYGTPGYPMHLRVTQDSEGLSAAIGREDAAFIAANDPATEIRRVEALLRMVERHAPIIWIRDIRHCMACHDGRGEREDWPCEDIRDLAAGEGIEVGDG